MNRRVLLIGHPRRPEAYEVAERLVEGLTAAGIEVAGIADELAAFGIAQRPGVVTVAPEEAGVACELAVVLGGDGTILRAAELSRDCGVPLLGINLGHVGFLAEAEKEDVERIVACVRERSWIVETRATLEVVATDGWLSTVFLKEDVYRQPSRTVRRVHDALRSRGWRGQLTPRPDFARYFRDY